MDYSNAKNMNGYFFMIFQLKSVKIFESISAVLTSWRTDGESDAVSTVFDQVHDVSVVKRIDINMIHCQDSVSYL